MKRYLKFIIAIIIPVAIGVTAGIFTSDAVNDWFSTINKPSFNPPNWIFAPVWTTLYILMGTAFFFVWISDAATDVKRQAFIFYSLQLILNFLWSLIFFGLHQPGWALLEIGLLWLMILFTIISFANISSIAAWLMIPYICWVSFAAVLNYFIWKLN